MQMNTEVNHVFSSAPNAILSKETKHVSYYPTVLMDGCCCTCVCVVGFRVSTTFLASVQVTSYELAMSLTSWAQNGPTHDVRGIHFHA